MIRVSVQLVSAICASRSKELARLDIFNDGKTTVLNSRKGSYLSLSYKGRDSATLDRAIPSKRAAVGDWPREALHVWNLVYRVLGAMGYTQTAPKVTADGGECAAEFEPVLAGYRKAVETGHGAFAWAYCDDPTNAGKLGAEDWEPLYAFRGPE